MKKIDFSYLKRKLKLSNDDISFLNDFFNQDEIFKKLSVVHKNKNELIRKFLILPAIILIFFIFAYVFKSERLFGVSILLFIFGLPIGAIVIDNYIDDLKFDFKSEILTPLALRVNSDLRYDTGGKYYFGEENYMGKIGFLKDYDGIFRIEDSIGYFPAEIDVKTRKNVFPFSIEGYEIVTYIKNGNNKHGMPKYETNNHCYLTKVTFNNAKDVFIDGLLLKRDTYDNVFQKLYMSLFIVLIFFAILIYIILPAFVFTYTYFNLSFLKSLSLNDIQSYIKNWLPLVFIIVYYFTYISYSKYIQKNRIKLENIDFEKKFDAYYSDNIESRELLTPGFMYKLVDYVSKVDSTRAYEFYFIKNIMYIKIEYIKWKGFDFFQGEFLKVGILSNVFKNLEQLVIFYRDFNNVVNLSHDLGLEYFDKSTYNNVVIK